MASPVDYRKLAHHSKGMYFTPHNSQDADGELTSHFWELAAAAGGEAPSHRQVAVQMGRKLEVPLAGRPPPPTPPPQTPLHGITIITSAGHMQFVSSGFVRGDVPNKVRGHLLLAVLFKTRPLSTMSLFAATRCNKSFSLQYARQIWWNEGMESRYRNVSTWNDCDPPPSPPPSNTGYLVPKSRVLLCNYSFCKEKLTVQQCDSLVLSVCPRPPAGAHMCLMSFKELCSNNLGAADYIALAGEFHTLALRGVPCFDTGNRPEAYRFVTLIDVMYEHRIRCQPSLRDCL